MSEVTTSRRQAIIQVLLDRLKRIERANGFQTDAGKVIFLGAGVELGDDDPDEALAVVVGDELPRFQGENLLINLPLTIEALVDASGTDLNQPWLRAEAIIADIKTAVELPDRTLGGLVKRQIERSNVSTLQRPAGSTTIGATVTYVAPYVEAWGAP